MSIIDSGKIVEVLFDNSDKFPENVYLDLMNMMKRHHEFGDNEHEIIEYLMNFDPSLILKFKIYTKKFSINISTLCKISILIFGVFAFVGVIVYCIINTSHKEVYSQPPSNYTG